MEPIQYPYNKEKEELENRIKILEKKLLIKRNFSILHSEFLKAEFLKTASRN